MKRLFITVFIATAVLIVDNTHAIIFNNLTDKDITAKVTIGPKSQEIHLKAGQVASHIATPPAQISVSVDGGNPKLIKNLKYSDTIAFTSNNGTIAIEHHKYNAAGKSSKIASCFKKLLPKRKSS